MLTSLSNVKKFLRIDPSVTKDDGILTFLASAANDAVLSAISRNVLQDTYREAYNGTGTPTLMLANTPISAVSSVALVAPLTSASAAQQSTALVAGVDFTYTQYAVKLLRGAFPRGVANVQVTYTAGYPSVPADLVLAATKYAAIRYRELDRLGHKSKTLAQETISFDLSEMPPDVLQICSRYQVKIPVVGFATGDV